jgi:aryl-alcohol dehydrogenase-like predicted oxidoreductase
VALALGESARLNLARYDCVQPRYNLLYREIEAEVLPLCRDQGLGVIAYNPLAGGLLTGKYRDLDGLPPGSRFTLGKTGDLYRERYWHRAQLEAVRQLQTHFQNKGVPLAAAAVAWVLAQPGVTAAIVGASRPGQLEESLASVDLTLDEDDREACNLAWYSLPRPLKPPG